MENIIRVEKLRKTFLTKHKEPGLSGSLRSVISPKFTEYSAVNGISFDVKKGDVLGFLGPNGAGKSTTIKMLVGILFPTSGNVDVLGYVPWKQRRKLAYKIGTVFGQKPQLWYHLPAIDTFNLMSKIYELEDGAYRRRLKYLVDLFEIDYLDIPVRRLSLGQRMRAEIVASLLHEPELLLLDEPTIGLDIIAKQKIRELIRELNRDDDVTVFLTSHDMDDVEKLCNRAIIINHGSIVLDDTLESMKHRYVQSKRIDVKLNEVPKRFAFPGATLVKRSPYALSIELDNRKGNISELIDYLTHSFKIADINIADPPIEEIIANIYRKK